MRLACTWNRGRPWRNSGWARRKRKAQTLERIRARAEKARERRRAPSKQGKLARGARPEGQDLGKQGTGAPRRKP